MGRILFTNDLDFYFEDIVEGYKIFLADNGNDDEFDEMAAYEWADNELNFYFDEFIADIKFMNNADKPHEITGVVARRDGIHEILPVKKNTLKEAVMRCIPNYDAIYQFELSDDEKTIIYTESNHDTPQGGTRLLINLLQ